ncbi:MAG TPA: hypothetical protein DCR17_07665 [Verrucomicrobiales bacterium]|nr:hypothetical protein [Pedosphaera sp.]HAO66549.1 hypothetical protein [Verrucomicrobiales bacterium]HAW02044.1 hypothetical protein [Verrucomicrobiales bacterium]HCP38028.1 hypothetical protein [Verrucomicrobiales bacterium]HCZ04953.1 hypothetical protein [Verrucomicrobiales bacterium]
MHAHSGGLRCGLSGVQWLQSPDRPFEVLRSKILSNDPSAVSTYHAFPDSAVRFVILHFPGAGCIEAIGSGA